MKKIYIILGILSFLFSLPGVYAQQKQTISISPNLQKAAVTSPYKLLNQDLSNKAISYDEWVTYLVYTIFDLSKLPEKYGTVKREKEITWILTEVFNNWNILEEGTKLELKKYGFTSNGSLKPPDFLTVSAESDHFEFHFSTDLSDTNAVDPADYDLNGIPDYVDKVMASFEYVYAQEIDTMKFTAPPSDSGNIGNSDKYDVYLLKIADDIYGYAAPIDMVNDNPNSQQLTEKNAATSYIVLRNNYSESVNFTSDEFMKVTIAHEFFHAVQFGYDVREKAWLMEATATWIEDEVYDDINQNIEYLSPWFSTPYISLDATQAEKENHWYGSWIFFKYVSEHLGGYKTVRSVWENSVKYDSKTKDYSFRALNDALVAAGSDFKKTFRNFVLANLYKTKAPYKYEEGEYYPEVKIIDRFVRSKKSLKYILYRHGVHYFEILPNIIPGNPDEMEFELTSDSIKVKLDLIVTTVSSAGIEVAQTTSAAGTATYSLSNPSSKDKIYAIVVNADTNRANCTLEITYKGNLTKISSQKEYGYGRFKDDYYIYKSIREYPYIEGYTRYDMTVHQYNMENGIYYEYTFVNSDGLTAYLSRKYGNVFAIVDFRESGMQYNFGLKYGSSYKLKGNFQVTQYPAVELNKVYFYGELYETDNFKSGIFSSDLRNGNPELIVDLTDTDYKIDIIRSYLSTFVALKNIYNTDYDELIYYNGSSVESFYTLTDGARIRTLNYDDKLAVWSESRDFVTDKVIKAYNLRTQELKTIRGYNSLDEWSVATSNSRIVWFEFVGSLTAIKFWENDTIKTIRTTSKGLYLNDNGVSSVSFKVPIDTGGVAWMENDFTLYYYQFSSGSLNSYDLSDYFTDRYLTSYIVRLSGKNIIIEATSALTADKTGIYVFKLGDMLTGIKNDELSASPKEFSLSQNYPNPFNPTTTIAYELPVAGKVDLRIYDILGREVITLINREQTAGKYKVTFDASSLSSGIYFYRLAAESGYISVKKMILLK